MSEEQNQMRYGEKILKEFDPQTDLEVWENKHEREYTIKITLPEFCCLCPRSGYPDFATIYLEYIPNKLVVELKAIKLYINSFMNRNISHEDSINEIYDVLFTKLEPKFMKIIGDFNPRGNVHTIIEVCSESILKKSENLEPVREFKYFNDSKRATARRINERDSGKRSSGRDNAKSSTRKFSDEKPKRAVNKDGFRKISYEGDKKPRVVKKEK
ncbi:MULTISPECIES: preQ(1) synthase [Campylobacter]|jgi:preQ(1) synthase|uniref:NADPH-dependent 7-cyano-7-deazaguanine reductase n=1 Tax=Campylobacter curvus (strain 525.92) TaxID=360105 RepID=A0A0M3V1R2_CAMC5|nr:MULTISPECIES: preQ(1) synthase [Campylobacter]ALF45081.1 7-cyano-7-deazaguanine reductase [Campylobacter curvus 525.92]EJP75959.1 preQ(1) synthase [Campylobacter sp. FOBRC14]